MNILIYKSGILYFTIYNEKDGIIGIALVKNSFKAELHSHKERETYIFTEGKGKLQIESSLLHSEALI